MLELRISGTHYAELKNMLFPGDGREAVAIALCGLQRASSKTVLLVHQLHPVPDHEYRERQAELVRWGTEWLIPLLAGAEKRKLAVLKLHSHIVKHPGHSRTDDSADRSFFESVHGWYETEMPHGSVVMMPDGELYARVVSPKGEFRSIPQVTVVGETVQIHGREGGTLEGHAARHAQALGDLTARLLRTLTVGVVGCSGTGSFVVELLARLGVGRLVLVDPEDIGEENLNRIVGSQCQDANDAVAKVEVARRNIASMGLGTEVVPLSCGIAERDAVVSLAGCDFLFGCVDSHDGRRLLNRLATYYILPYIDVGVRLDADGRGGIEHISGAVHYLEPGKSSLLTRRVIDNERATAEAWARENPKAHADLTREGYLRGAEEGSRPAVVSINAMFAAMAVTEMLARIHAFRNDDRATTQQRFSIAPDLYYFPEGEAAIDEGLACKVGRGDVHPLLDMPEFG